MKSKLLYILRRRHYPLIALLLAGAAFVPALNFLIMANILDRPGGFDITLVIPFTAVTAAVLFGFLLLPLLKKLTLRKKCIIISVAGALIFCGLDILAQNIAANDESTAIPLDSYISHIHGIPLNELIHTRSGIVLGPDGIELPEYSFRFPERIIPAPDIDEPPLEILWDRWAPQPHFYRINLDDLMHSRMMRPPAYVFVDPAILPQSALNDAGMIPWQIRMHYYIFSIILVLAALNWLAAFSEALSGKEKPQKKLLIVQGTALICYTLAYLFVRVVQYEDFMTRHITWASVLNAAVCFVLAAIAAGLYTGSLLGFSGRVRRVVPSILSAATVLVLYAAQYIMLDGNFYSFGGNAFIALAVRGLVVIVPGIIVYFLLRLTFNTDEGTSENDLL